MRRISTGYIVLIFLMLSCDTANNVDEVFRSYFVKYYGEDGNQEGVDLLVNPDGTMFILANSSLQTNPNNIPFMIKVDPEGNVLWQRQLGERNERAVDVEFDNQGNLIVVSNSGDEATSKVRIFRIDQQGHGIDSTIIDKLEKQVAMSVTVLSDDNILIVGYSGPFGDNPYLTSPPIDESDRLMIQLDASWNSKVTLLSGEHLGRFVKAFEITPERYYMFGDSDRPLIDGSGAYKRAFEAIPVNNFGIPGATLQTGPLDEIQILSSVIKTPSSVQEGYLMIGTTSVGNSSNIYLTQYLQGLKGPRFSMSLLLQRRLQGISGAVAEPDHFFILADELRENNNTRDIILLKLAGDGGVLDSYSFGTVEGDDSAGAVRVLPDGRVAVLGTMELETQRKIALIIMNQNGKFSN